MSKPERDLYQNPETIQQITKGLDGSFTLHTAVAAIMELVNAMDASKIVLFSVRTGDLSSCYGKSYITNITLCSAHC